MNTLTTQKNTSTALTIPDQPEQFLTFLIGQESFAISILDVKEIIEITSVTHVPMTPDFIHGVINLRGNVVPVIDLSVRLMHSKTEISKKSCIVLVELDLTDGAQLIGMLVDEVQEILEIPGENLQPPPDFGTEIRTDFIQAMARIEDKFIILLEINKVLSVKELSQLETIAASSSVEDD